MLSLWLIYFPPIKWVKETKPLAQLNQIKFIWEFLLGRSTAYVRVAIET